MYEIEALSPGLYEMKIDNPSGDPDCHKPAYKVGFEARQVEDLKVDYPREAFERVRQVSEFNEPLYRSEEHTSELQSLMRISYAVLCLKKKNTLQPLTQIKQ